MRRSNVQIMQIACKTGRCRITPNTYPIKQYNNPPLIPKKSREYLLPPLILLIPIMYPIYNAFSISSWYRIITSMVSGALVVFVVKGLFETSVAHAITYYLPALFI
jgi:hypothetical protein